MSCMPARIEATHRCRLLMFTCVVVVESVVETHVTCQTGVSTGHHGTQWK